MIKPLQNFVLIEPIKKEATKSGIIIPEDADLDPTYQAIVVALGEKVTIPVKKGDKVLIKEYGFDKMKVGEKEHLLGREENIIAIIS